MIHSSFSLSAISSFPFCMFVHPAAHQPAIFPSFAALFVSILHILILLLLLVFPSIDVHFDSHSDSSGSAPSASSSACPSPPSVSDIISSSCSFPVYLPFYVLHTFPPLPILSSSFCIQQSAFCCLKATVPFYLSAFPVVFCFPSPPLHFHVFYVLSFLFQLTD